MDAHGLTWRGRTQGSSSGAPLDRPEDSPAGHRYLLTCDKQPGFKDDKSRMKSRHSMFKFRWGDKPVRAS